MELFWRDGYAATSLQSLLSHMGISRQSLYNTFGDKRALFLAALDRYMESKAALSLAELEAPGAGMDAILGFFDRLGQRAQTSCENGTAPRTCMIGRTCMELSTEDPEVRQRVTAYFERCVAAFRGALENAQAHGEIEALDAPAVARHLTATVNGLGIMHKGGVTHDELGDVVRVALSVIRPKREA